MSNVKRLSDKNTRNITVFGREVTINAKYKWFIVERDVLSINHAKYDIVAFYEKPEYSAEDDAWYTSGTGWKSRTTVIDSTCDVDFQKYINKAVNIE